tara:strand:- start:2217 stop:2576 length:360 start_codon:yes stop_codon:yes gene_type:complete
MREVNPESIDDVLSAWAGVTRGFPFDEKTLVYKVGGKMFALFDVDNFEGVNLKCDPERAVELREMYAGVRPGYHMNKVHWNTVEPMSDVRAELFWDLLKHSYDLVAASLPKKVKIEFGL